MIILFLNFLAQSFCTESLYAKIALALRKHFNFETYNCSCKQLGQQNH